MKVNFDICDRCATCIAVCPVSAIMMDIESLVFDEELCTECGICVISCPVGALTAESKQDMKRVT